MRFLYLLFVLSPSAWGQSLKQEYTSEEIKWAANKQTHDSLSTILKLRNEVCDLRASNLKLHGKDYMRRCDENSTQLLNRYRYYKGELNRKKQTVLNHAADSTMERITSYTIHLKNSITARLPDPEFKPFVYESGDTSNLPKGKITLERLQQLKAKNEELQRVSDRNKQQIRELDSLAEVYSTKFQELQELWKQYEIDSRTFDEYAFYMKTQLEVLNAKPEPGAQPRIK